MVYAEQQPFLHDSQLLIHYDLPQLPSTMVTLACWVYYGTNDSFAVTASPGQTVCMLKKAIMDEDPNRFPGIHAGLL